MHHRHHICVACLLVVLLASWPAVAGEPALLRLKLPRGAVFQMRMTAEQQVALPQRDASMDQWLSTGMRLEVTEVDGEGTQTVTVTYTHVALRQKGVMGTVEFDSTRPPEVIPLTAQPFAALVDQKFTVGLSPQGQVRWLEGLDVLVQKMLGGLKMGDGPAKAAMEKGIRDQFGPEAMQQNLQNLLNVYPEDPVQVGDSWTHTGAMKQGLPLVARTTYRVEEMTDQTVTLAASSTVSPNPDAGPMDMGAMKVRYTLEGTQRGTMELDRATGWTRRSRMEQAFTGRMQLTIGQQTVEEPIRITGTVTLAGE